MPLVCSRARRFGRFASWFVFAFTVLGSTRALARPPYVVPEDTLHPFVIEPARGGTPRTLVIPPSLQAVLRRMGGARAVRMAQGVPAGRRLALRPMFWVTRDRSGAMFALGGLF